MNLFVFLRIARNFIRSFCLTLILLISWDLWRRLVHAAPANPPVLVIDTILLGVVIFLGVASRLKEARKQLKYFFRLSNNGFYAACIIFPLAISFKVTPANRQDGLLLLALCALFADIVRVCKIRIVISPGIYLIGGSFGFFAYEISTLGSWLGQQWEDMARWSTAFTYTANILVLIILRALTRWLEEQQSFPTIQPLGLNSQGHPAGRTPSPTSTARLT